MNLPSCPKCKAKQSTKKAIYIGRSMGLLLFNCFQHGCGSTFALKGETSCKEKFNLLGVRDGSTNKKRD